MSVSFDIFTGAFLSKITEYDFIEFTDEEREDIVDRCMKRALGEFKRVCKYDLVAAVNDEERVFDVDIDDSDIDEIVDIVSEGMVVQWLKPYVYSQENLRNAISTRDFSVYSPAELLMRIGNAYRRAQKDYTQMIREYSYNNGDLTVLHI